MLIGYLAVAGVFGALAFGYQAVTEKEIAGGQLWAANLKIALSFAVIWPFVLVAAPLVYIVAKRQESIKPWTLSQS